MRAVAAISRLIVAAAALVLAVAAYMGVRDGIRVQVSTPAFADDGRPVPPGFWVSVRQFNY